MKVKINSRGFLEIERAGKFKTVECPFQVQMVSCGDWCALFGEIIDYTMYGGNSCPSSTWKNAELSICHRTFTSDKDKFIDEREKK